MSVCVVLTEGLYLDLLQDLPLYFMCDYCYVIIVMIIGMVDTRL